MNKISSAQVGQMMKLAAENLRALSEDYQKVTAERDEFQAKLASYEREKRIEKVAQSMELKGLNSELSYEQKVAQLRDHEKLDVLEEAVSMSAPQMKLASVDDSGQIQEDGEGVSGSHAESSFLASLVSME